MEEKIKDFISDFSYSDLSVVELDKGVFNYKFIYNGFVVEIRNTENGYLACINETFGRDGTSFEYRDLDTLLKEVELVLINGL